MLAYALNLQNSNKTVRYSGTPEQVEFECDALGRLDKKTESKKKKLVTIIMVVPFFVFQILYTVFSVESSLVVGIAAIGVAGFGIYFLLINRHDIEDRKLELAQWILGTLKPELRANRPVRLDLDFRGYDNPRAADSWLNLAMTLQDGVGLRLSVSTHFKRKTRSKRKYTKIKDKLHERVSVTFIAPKGKSFDPSAQEHFRSYPVPRLQLRSVKITPKAATVVYATEQMMRIRNRRGWSDQGSGFMEGPMSLAAVIASYRALGVAAGAGGS